MPREFLLRNLGLLMLLALAAGNALAATGVTREVLPSKVLDEDRPLNIVLPEDYTTEKSYAVVYALDGGTKYIADVAARMQSAHRDLIVVGVQNVDRTRDMFPEPMAAKNGRGGGGKQFLEFLTTELVPFIETRYSTNGYRVLSGQSNSGFFVLYALLNSPGTYDAYLASSPMIGWDRDMIHDGTRKLLDGQGSVARVLFMNQGDDDLDRVTGYLPAYEELLRDVAPPDFRWKNELIEGGGHVPASTYANGIAFIFAPR